eukprot:227823-Amphidinium_carterae.1
MDIASADLCVAYCYAHCWSGLCILGSIHEEATGGAYRMLFNQGTVLAFQRILPCSPEKTTETAVLGRW